MNRYRVPTLTAKTTEADRERLKVAMEELPGVERVTLHPESSEIELRCNDEREPKYEVIAAAASNAGFDDGFTRSHSSDYESP